MNRRTTTSAIALFTIITWSVLGCTDGRSRDAARTQDPNNKADTSGELPHDPDDDGEHGFDAAVDAPRDAVVADSGDAAADADADGAVDGAADGAVDGAADSADAGDSAGDGAADGATDGSGDGAPDGAADAPADAADSATDSAADAADGGGLSTVIICKTTTGGLSGSFDFTIAELPTQTFTITVGVDGSDCKATFVPRGIIHVTEADSSTSVLAGIAVNPSTDLVSVSGRTVTVNASSFSIFPRVTFTNAPNP